MTEPTNPDPVLAETPAPEPAPVGAVPPKRRYRNLRIFAITVGVLFLLFGFFLGSVTVLDYTESTQFCSLCHVMNPEVTVYHNSPHARTECGTCHIGPGAVPAVQAKLAAIRYLWVYPLNTYERPIPSPITSMRPASVVCEQCHWPEKYYEDRLRVIPEYGLDASNTLSITTLVMKTGGGTLQAGQGRGIHWHIDNPVYYIATDDKRQDIPWVSAEYSGTVTEYISTDSTLTAEQIASAEKRKMDCIDCHNRASHAFQNPDEALNNAMANGTIPADLPYIKQYGVQLLGKTYATEAEAASAIATLPDLYKSEHPEVYFAREADIKAAAASLQTIFNSIQFPFMNVTWESHTDNIGHKDFPGCFRCHDGKHLSNDNQAIRLECNICHSIPQVTGPGKPPAIIPVSTGAEPPSHHSTTWLAEHRFKFDTTCAECHKVDNPGGNDSSSFCSNSACHATQWKYVGLNAPKVRQLTAPPKVPSSGVPGPIPHPVGGRTDCLICHGPGKVRPFPDSHADFKIDVCVTCHKPTLQELPPTAAPTPTAAATSAPQALSTAAQAPTAAAAAGSAPAISHELAGRDNCLICHNPAGGPRPAPQDHAGRSNETCQVCHKPAPAAGTPSGTATATAARSSSGTATPTTTPTAAAAAGSAPAISHELAGRDNCLICHNPTGGLRPAPQDHAGRANGTCQACHKPARPAGTPSAAATAASTPVTGEDTEGPPAISHELAGRDNCLICHNATGGLRPAPQDHAGRANGTCQACHKPAAQ